MDREEEAPKRSGILAGVMKRTLIGRPMSSGELGHTLLPKIIALPVFASDALSSMAYATQEVMLVLVIAGPHVLDLVFPVAVAVSVLLVIVIASYRQLVRAYPGGGGAYVVAYENLGSTAGLVVAASLLLDYSLTVAVSITAGADALVSAATGLSPFKMQITVGLIALVTLANLRGSKESGRLFAVPTYGFVLSIYALIITGVLKCTGGCPQAETAGVQPEHAAQALTVLLLLRAFSAGTTALTGVEAIAEGVPVFRFPQSRNAATTLGILGGLSVSMFLGLSWLAAHTNAVYTEEAERTLVAQVANAVFAGGPMFYVVQVMTALILILAANTAYTGFPVLASILAKDRFLPRQFQNRGDRLVYSNGIVILAVAASLLVWMFDANLNSLIQLYLVGVFLSFTLAQAGTVLRWRRTREAGWKRSAAINTLGAAATGIVLVVVLISKFVQGAWIVITALPVLIFMMRSINKHYESLREQLATPERRPTDRRPGNHHMVLFVPTVDAATARAIGYIRSIRPSSITGVTRSRAVHGAWNRMAPEIDLQTLARRGSLASDLRSFLREKRETLGSDDFLTLVVPEVLRTKSLLLEILLRPRLHRLKASLLLEPGVQVMSVPIVEDEIVPGVDESHEPARNYAVVLVSGLHNATLQALEYGENLRPTRISSVSFGLIPEELERLGNDWIDSQIPHALEIEAAPFRSLGASLRRYLRQFDADGIDRIVTVIIPEFIVSKRRHQLLHGQNALVVKRHLLFERGVVTVSVPFHVED